MRIAILSDVHAHAQALRAVLRDASDAGASRVISLGDMLGYGPDPLETLELVHERVHVCLAGNHDDAVCGRMPTDDFSPFAAGLVERHRAALGPEALAWLRSLAYVHEGNGFACTHGDFTDPAWFNYVIDESDAVPGWEVRAEQLLFVGHTHEPCIFVTGSSGKTHKLDPVDFVLESGKRYLVNPGSVGYPRNETCRSSYVIYDDVERSVEFRTLPFDLESYRTRMEGRGLDEAPWMHARERAQHTPRLRAEACFAAMPPARRRVSPRVRLACCAGGAGLVLAGVALGFSVRRDRPQPSAPVSAVAPGVPTAPVRVSLHARPIPSGSKNVLFGVAVERESLVGVELTLVFADAAGKIVREQSYVLRSGAKSWRPRVPSGAARVELFARSVPGSPPPVLKSFEVR